MPLIVIHLIEGLDFFVCAVRTPEVISNSLRVERCCMYNDHLSRLAMRAFPVRVWLL